MIETLTEEQKALVCKLLNDNLARLGAKLVALRKRVDEVQDEYNKTLVTILELTGDDNAE